MRVAIDQAIDFSLMWCVSLACNHDMVMWMGESVGCDCANVGKVMKRILRCTGTGMD